VQNEFNTVQTDSQNDKSSDWQKVGENLLRYVPSGTYYARIRAGGKLHRQSLKTDVYSTAKLRLSDLEKSLRQMTERQTEVSKGTMTFGDALAIFQQRKQGDPTVKPNTKLYYENLIKALLKSWPALKEKDIRKLSKNDCLAWAARYSASASATAYNNTTSIVKSVCEIAQEFGGRLDNPAKSLKRVTIKLTPLVLPNSDQFKRFVESVGSGGGNRNRFSQPCAFLVQFLAFGGFRISEAANVRWQDIDFGKGTILVRGDDATGTKNSETRIIPIMPQMRKLLQDIQAYNAKLNRSVQPQDRVMEVSECQKSMNRACVEVGMERITHHDLRHYFATRCIEAGVDIPTVSRWLGHVDGGALAMRVYGHLRQEHSAKMAEKVSF
jgi:integrase